MSIKKKLGLGVASAALGLSLVAGGTFAYFNDTATLHNAFASGTLTLDLEKAWSNTPINFDLKNIKPGDSFERTFVLANNGTLDIGDIFMTVTDAGSDAALLETLTVTYFVDATEPYGDPGASDQSYYLLNSKDITLAEAIDKQFDGKIKPMYLTDDGELNLTPTGVKAGEDNRFRMVITFPETGEEQNALQNLSAKVNFTFDGRQLPGTKQNQHGPNNGDLEDPTTN